MNDDYYTMGLTTTTGGTSSITINHVTPPGSASVTSQPPDDPVNHPSHYTDGGIETIDYIEAKRLPYHLGNAVKYISRAGKKNPGATVEDLRKAVWYINRYIKLLGGE